MEGSSENLIISKQEKILQLFPEVGVEGKIDFDSLRNLLGDYVDSRHEKYSFMWSGKLAAKKVVNVPSMGTLLFDQKKSYNQSSNRNDIYIEGDNLETLKLLQKSYHKKIKMIYIDPPYNTGNEFIYPDKFQDNLATYLKYTGQADNLGQTFTTNSESSGRFHTKWLSMMYPRLCLAKNLLKEDGVIFISIDDNELMNLLKLCNEIFGEENHIGTFVWQSKKGGGSDSRTIVKDHEYILAFSKESPEMSASRSLVESEPLDKEDDVGPYRKGREMNKWGANSRRSDRPTMWFSVPGPDGEQVFPIRNDGSEGCWRFGKVSMQNFVDEDLLLFEKRENGTYVVYEKIRTTDPRSKPFRSFLKDVGTTADGSKIVKELFDGKKIFDFPKPVDLMKHLIQIGTNSSSDIILDFFAGSCTTAQAVLEYNKENDVDLSYMCIQLPEKCSEDSEAFKEGFKTISDIGRDRIKRVIESLDLDRGYISFKLSSSNIKSWDSDSSDIKKSLFDSVDNVKPDRSETDVLYEILLKYGLSLSVPIEHHEVNGGNVYSVGFGALIICLENDLNFETIEEIGKLKNKINPSTVRVIFKDSGFKDDSVKVNAIQILKQYGIEDVKSI